VLLPPYTGFATFAVEVPTGSDAINVMLAPASTIAVAPASLQFAYATTGAVPAPQSVQLSNTGGGTLAWSAVTNASWLAVTPSSGTAPSTLSVSVSPAGLSAGTYLASIQISAAGATNSPVAVAVTLTVTATGPASLAVAPQELMYSYTVGGAVPAAQAVSITNGRRNAPLGCLGGRVLGRPLARVGHGSGYAVGIGQSRSPVGGHVHR
jgi:hypothetical protein